MDAELHYDAGYFHDRQAIHEFGGWANLGKFERHIKSTDTVLDFGCSGGYLLDHVQCARKIGVELNPVPRAVAESKGHRVYERTASVPDESVDVVISNHVLEHTKSPLAELEALRSKLVSGGKIVLAVPCEGSALQFKPNDSDFHLYTWSPLNLGNLLTAAGFTVHESRRYVHRWPPGVRRYGRQLGRPAFDLLCGLYALTQPSRSQVLAVAVK